MYAAMLRGNVDAGELEAEGYRDGLLRVPAAWLDADYQAGWRRGWRETTESIEAARRS